MIRPETGVAIAYRDGIRRILAPNPGPMTHWGTNTWLLGESGIAIIDPGPDDPRHVDAILTATRGQVVSHILVTHAHADHSPAARVLSRTCDAPVIAFGPSTAGRSETMTRLAQEAAIAGGEGLDANFVPDASVTEGDSVRGNEWSIEVLHTPGHFAGHLAFRFEDVLFSGDHVMDWSTSLVSPPDGDVSAFLETSTRLSRLPISTYLTGHGGEIREPKARLDWLISHRQRREAEILEGLARGLSTVQALTQDIYRDTPPAMHKAASRNVLAHLIDLVERKSVRATPAIGIEARFTLV